MDLTDRTPARVAVDDPVGGAFAALLATPGVREVLELRSTFGFLAFHGGGLEEMTDVVASAAAARAGASYYGVIHPDGWDRHLRSTLVRPEGSPQLAAFLDHVEVAIAVHGYGRVDRWTTLLLGGSNRELAAHLGEHLTAALPDYVICTEMDEIPAELRGIHPDNPVNRPRFGGVQLELPPRVRGRSPFSPPPGPDGLSPPTAALIAALASAARTWPDPDPDPDTRPEAVGPDLGG
ncbi:MAG: replication protein [Acidimicrobiales bacterium]|nr:replication protein [Acidimicrobiales bacterium]